MSEKPLCGYCYNECTDDCCDKRKVDVLTKQLEVYKSIAEEAIEVTPAHFDEGYGWSKSIEQLKEKGE